MEQKLNTFIVILLLVLIVADHFSWLAVTLNSLYGSMLPLVLILSLLLLVFPFVSTIVVSVRLADPFTNDMRWIRQVERWAEKTLFSLYLTLVQLAVLAYYAYRPETTVGVVGMYTITVMVVWLLYVLVSERRTILRTMLEIVKNDPEAHQFLSARKRRA